MPKKRYILFLLIITNLMFCSTAYASFYRYNIDELARKAKVRIKEIEQKIAEKKTTAELQNILAKLTALYEKAETLFQERRYEEAATVYRKIDKMSGDKE